MAYGSTPDAGQPTPRQATQYIKGDTIAPINDYLWSGVPLTPIQPIKSLEFTFRASEYTTHVYVAAWEADEQPDTDGVCFERVQFTHGGFGPGRVDARDTAIANYINAEFDGNNGPVSVVFLDGTASHRRTFDPEHQRVPVYRTVTDYETKFTGYTAR